MAINEQILKKVEKSNLDPSWASWSLAWTRFGHYAKIGAELCSEVGPGLIN